MNEQVAKAIQTLGIEVSTKSEKVRQNGDETAE